MKSLTFSTRYSFKFYGSSSLFRYYFDKVLQNTNKHFLCIDYCLNYYLILTSYFVRYLSRSTRMYLFFLLFLSVDPVDGLILLLRYAKKTWPRVAQLRFDFSNSCSTLSLLISRSGTPVIRSFTVPRSPFVHKKALDHFSSRLNTVQSRMDVRGAW
jgi:predicted membrane channel-forming protein YqfA (hemolysin III family)